LGAGEFDACQQGGSIFFDGNAIGSQCNGFAETAPSDIPITLLFLGSRPGSTMAMAGFMAIERFHATQHSLFVRYIMRGTEIGMRLQYV
jgi:hypothetical protein